MRIQVRVLLSLVLMLASKIAGAQAESQAYLVCGTSVCQPNINAVYFVGKVSGINDLDVGGHYFDVSFTSSPHVSPFVLSSVAAAPGQPATGIDAADAIAAVYGALQPPYGNYNIAGDQGPSFIAAYGSAGSLSSSFFGSTELYDIVQTNVGGGYVNVGEVGASGFTSSNVRIAIPSEAHYTNWTPIAAPEMDPGLVGSGLLLLMGGLAILRGRRPPLH